MISTRSLLKTLVCLITLRSSLSWFQSAVSSFPKWFQSSSNNKVTTGASGTVAVVGANGRTGNKLVQLALAKRYRVNAITRGGSYLGPKSEEALLVDVAGDITIKRKLSTEDRDASDAALVNALKGSKACFFAASASKEGGSAQQVDRDGLIEIAKLCIANRVPRLVIVSSGAVSKPFSPVYLFLNLFGGIMKAKFEGENEVRKLYNSAEAQSAGLAYTIVRPGGLTEDEGRGVTAVELNQGDDRSGRISRWDVAAICVESIDAADAANATFECYYGDTAQPLANVGFNNILKRKTADAEKELTGRERLGSSWPELFRGLSRD